MICKPFSTSTDRQYKGEMFNVEDGKRCLTHSEFDACNTVQRNWDRTNKRLGKLWNAQKTPVWNIPQVKWHQATEKGVGIKGATSKGSVPLQHGQGEVHHFV